jgi:hypothetical protein
MAGLVDHYKFTRSSIPDSDVSRAQRKP